MTLDCSKLNGDFDLSKANPPKGALDNKCKNIIAQSWEQANAKLGKCGSDGRDIVYNWKETSRFDLKQKGACNASPLVIDLGGDGIRLTSLEQGVSFDLLATGSAQKTAWISKDDALLAIDWNQNGRIDDATELFGEQSFGQEHADGFIALRDLDTNGDSRIDARDASFVDLLVWKDANQNGVSEVGELVSLKDTGIRSLPVVAVSVPENDSYDAFGNQTPLRASFERTDGTRGAIVDAFFRFKP